jgi:sirohydrochlorin ferrochelatase
MKKALLVVAHGSRRRQSNDEVIELATAVAASTAHDFNVVKSAFLEIAQPSIPEVIKTLAKKGVDQISVVPYFLAAGTHVANDIPAIIEQAKADYPAITFVDSEHIGASTMMTRLILDAAQS